jgi:hypothetical protein
MEKPPNVSRPDTYPIPPLPPRTGLSIGDAALKISIDADSVDQLIARLERSLAAFKREWQRK